MNRFLFLFLLFVVLVPEGLAQNRLQRPSNPDYPGQYSSRFLRRSSLMATIGTGFTGHGENRLSSFGLGEWSYAYALHKQWDLGLGVYGSLLCNKAYRDDQGQIQGAEGDPETDPCTQSWKPATLILLGRYFPLEGLPVFAQGGFGYALDGQAPVLLAGAGYHYRVIERISVAGIIRYARLLAGPSTPDWVRPAGGLRLELGLFWHH